ncbi:Serine/threonine-protein kinase RsbT [Pigmentiphaga humi]|uniref:Serine/threonine-protein kinase RsbT n=1 Tax=Pigmentiphaga humi TaxID=2478468 RepID=A0A3P4AVF1_9BURK|nr:SpoIIE family protein phosphatase [Pigmentiphaga humi]VCU68024.1 Serine/threonine-protein kinase RsbT [Pigmentiphaga humi]
MRPHAVFPVTDASRVGEARRWAVAEAVAQGADDVLAGQVALVVTELGSNLVKHARQGRLLMGLADLGGGICLDILSMDEGPGISDAAACVRDGYSTAGTLGGGLGAIRRLAHVFDLHSSAAEGTIVFARFHISGTPTAGFIAAGLCVAAPGERVSGDGWRVLADGRGVRAVLADGLGHGIEAAKASDAALDCFAEQAWSGPASYLTRAHAALRTTRGAAAAALDADAGSREVRYASIGNVTARFVSGLYDKSLVSQNGTVGLQIRTVAEQRAAWPPHAVLVLYSDGITSRWTLDGQPDILHHHPAIIAAFILRGYTRGRDDTTLIVIRLQEH